MSKFLGKAFNNNMHYTQTRHNALISLDLTQDEGLLLANACHAISEEICYILSRPPKKCPTFFQSQNETAEIRHLMFHITQSKSGTWNISYKDGVHHWHASRAHDWCKSNLSRRSQLHLSKIDACF